MKNILLIDGNSITYRAYYATANSPQGILTNSKGEPVNAILVLNRIIKKAIENYKPTHILIAFDAGSETFRHEEMPDYKSGRSKTPEELLFQIPIVKEMIDLMGIKHFELNLIEADDIIATIALKYYDEYKINILSSDKDLLQLVSKNINIIQPQNNNKEDKIINLDNFEKINGHKPSQVVDFKGLVGDSSDSLPGVKGLGPKTANKLLEKFQNLEKIYENLENLNDSLKSKLIEDKEMAKKCKKLATLKFDVKIPYQIDDLEFKNVTVPKLIDFYKKYELSSLIPPKEPIVPEKESSIVKKPSPVEKEQSPVEKEQSPVEKKPSKQNKKFTNILF